MNLRKIKYNDFICLLSNQEKLVVFLQETGFLIPTNINQLNYRQKYCSHCVNGLLKIVNCKSFCLGIKYCCTSCNKTFNVLNETSLSGLHITKFLEILAGFVEEKKIATIIKDSKINETTVYKYFSLIRKTIVDIFNHNAISLGGEGHVVEIDESHLFRRKYNRGNILSFQNIWIFGIFERVTKKIFVKRVETRDSNTLYEIVRSHVLPGTIIKSDMWRGYSKISEHYILNSVNHKNNFVDPDDSSTHTNNIERLWRSLKVSLLGVSCENVDDHLVLFMFRRNMMNYTFFEKITAILSLFI